MLYRETCDGRMSTAAKLDMNPSETYHRISMKPTVGCDVSGGSAEVRPSFNLKCQKRREELKGLVRRLLSSAPLVGALLLLSVAAVRAQDEHKRKVPVLDKITTTNGQEAFSGSIQAVDLKTSLLQVHSTADNTDEYFPLKKTVHVANAAGERVAVDHLKPGVSVLVYYEQKGDHRAVKEIVVLGKAAEVPKAKSSPPS